MRRAIAYPLMRPLRSVALPAGRRRTMHCSCGPWRRRAPKHLPCTTQRGMRCWQRGSSWCEGRDEGMSACKPGGGGKVRRVELGRADGSALVRSRQQCSGDCASPCVSSHVALQVGSCRNGEDEERIATLKGEAPGAGARNACACTVPDGVVVLIWPCTSSRSSRLSRAAPTCLPPTPNSRHCSAVRVPTCSAG